MPALDIVALRKELKQNQSSFAESIDISQPYLSEIERGLKPVSKDIEDRIAEKYGIDLVRNYCNKSDREPQMSYSAGVPYYEDIESSGGIIPSMNENGREIPTFFINYEHFNDCTAYLQHVGDSMYPKYCSGEIIAVKRIFNLNVVLWGEAYLVITNDNANSLRTVKLLFQHEDEDKIILRSSNPNFKGDTIINKIDIISMFIVKGKITRNQL